jgi:hypothetical protein
MGTITFLLPAGLGNGTLQELERAGMLGGQDAMPYPATIVVDPQQLRLGRSMEESGYVIAPWEVDGAGLLMISTPTVIERPQPYYLQVELARGKVNQVRCQAADWTMGGLDLSPRVEDLIREATRTFARAASYLPDPKAGPHAQQALTLACQASEELVRAYVGQVFQFRHQRQSRLDTALACRLGPELPGDALAAPLLDAFNTVTVPFSWGEVEPSEADYRWEPYESVLTWAQAQNVDVMGGPLIDFSAARLPDWLWLWEGDISNLAGFMCDYVELAVKRYRGRIRTWQLTAGANASAVLGLGEDELLWLTVRLVEAARQVDPSLELVVGIAQPWGEYMTVYDRPHTPFMFADTLIRAGLNLAALDLELVMGVSPRGSYCRDPLEVSRILDLYALLGVPLHVTLGYPSGEDPDFKADPDLSVSGGHWRDGFSPDRQADWVDTFAALALCKPAVRCVQWCHLLDGDRHQFPNCGLADGDGAVKPALRRLADLRRQHVR